jgi:hypothetical protein
MVQKRMWLMLSTWSMDYNIKLLKVEYPSIPRSNLSQFLKLELRVPKMLKMKMTSIGG